MSAPQHGASRRPARGVPAHSAPRSGAGRQPARRVPRTPSALLVAAAAVLVVLAGAVAVVAFHGTSRSPAAEHGSIPVKVARAMPSTTTTAPVPPLRVVSTSPAGGAEDVAYSPAVTVQLSAPLAQGSPMPVLTPPVPGTWTAKPAGTLVFQPDADYAPYTTVSLTIPGGAEGLRDARGATLPTSVTTSFTVAGGSELRLQQLLAELQYLPFTFVRTSSPSAPAIDAEAATPGRIALTPLPGRLAWRWQGTPALLSSLWSPGTDNVVTRGAVMAFESQVGLDVDGEAGPAVWQALLAAVAARKVDPAPYDWIDVSEAAPETLTVWQDGADVLTVYANTGISEAPTAPGTYPVYARYLVTTMSGKNPNGTHYQDPGIPHVAYFNGGDAIHGFIRSGYGYPQSLGCVELTYADAAEVWPYDQLGTLVTVH